MCIYHLKEGFKMKEKANLKEFRIEVEQKQRRIYVLIKTKDPLDAIDIAHAIVFKTATFGPDGAIPTWKVLP
jgi:ATP sulfurylase